MYVDGKHDLQTVEIKGQLYTLGFNKVGEYNAYVLVLAKGGYSSSPTPDIVAQVQFSDPNNNKSFPVIKPNVIEDFNSQLTKYFGGDIPVGNTFCELVEAWLKSITITVAADIPQIA